MPKSARTGSLTNLNRLDFFMLRGCARAHAAPEVYVRARADSVCAGLRLEARMSYSSQIRLRDGR